MKSKKTSNYRFVFGLSACLVAVLFALAIAKTVIWKYVDDKGAAHYVDEYYKIPAKYQPKAVKIEVEGVTPQISSQPSSPPPKKQPTKEEQQAKLKAIWVMKARDAYGAVISNEEALTRTQPECDAAFMKWTNMPIQENRNELDACLARIEAIKKEIAKTKEYRDRGIYSDAMGAGVPIMWIDQAYEQYKKELEQQQ